MPDEENIEDKLDFELEPLAEEGDDLPDMDAEDDSSVDPSLQMQITRVQEEVELLEQLVTRPPLLPSPFPATVGTDGSFTELCILNGTLSTFADGRTGTAISLGTGQSVLMEVRDDPTMRFLVVGGGSGRASGDYEVLVKANGVDGDNNPLYDLYDLADTGLVTKLNLAGALAPNNSRARLAAGVTPIAVADGSKGVAYTETDGTIALESVPETLCSATTTVIAGAV